MIDLRTSLLGQRELIIWCTGGQLFKILIRSRCGIHMHNTVWYESLQTWKSVQSGRIFYCLWMKIVIQTVGMQAVLGPNTTFHQSSPKLVKQQSQRKTVTRKQVSQSLLREFNWSQKSRIKRDALNVPLFGGWRRTDLNKMADRAIKVSVLEGNFALRNLGLPLSVSIQLQEMGLRLPDALWTVRSSSSGFSVSLPTRNIRQDLDKIMARMQQDHGRNLVMILNGSSGILEQILTRSHMILKESWKILDDSRKILDDSCKVLDDSCTIWNVSCKIWNVSCKIWDVSCKCLGISCMVLVIQIWSFKWSCKNK